MKFEDVIQALFLLLVITPPGLRNYTTCAEHNMKGCVHHVPLIGCGIDGATWIYFDIVAFYKHAR
jgi:hypothetical protein